MKRVGALLMALIIALMLSGCGGGNDPVATSPSPTIDPAASPDPLASPGVTSDPLKDLADPLDDFADDGALDAPDDGDGADEDLSDLIDDGSDPMGADEDPSAIGTPTPTPSATPGKSTPAAEIKPKDYVLTTYVDDALGLSIDYPEHWAVDASSASTLSFTEPTEAGKNPMRFALTVKTFDQDKLTAADQKKLFKDYVNNLKSDYTGFKVADPNNKTPFINRTALNVTYLAKQNKATIKGYVIMTAIPESKQIVALHFSAPQAKYKAASAFFKKTLYSVAVVKPAA